MLPTPMSSMTSSVIAPIFGQAVPLVGHRESAVRARQWELVEFAGEGSLATVYRARPAAGPTDRPAAYAVKMLRHEWQDDQSAIQLMQREALAAATVFHPHVVPILAAYVLDTPHMLVMPWLEGATLQARWQRNEAFLLPTILWIARQVAEALDAFDAVGWMHGDVTPGNIHLSSSGHVTLLDLSFARPCKDFGSAADRPIMGTCNYIAPEQITSTMQADIRSDIYSLGAVLFEMLCGRPPYQAKDLADLVTQHRQSASLDLLRPLPHLPHEASTLVRAMLANDPLRRPQTPRELIRRLVALEIATFGDRA
jgi:eukaryotic-like serine/threonine-protein kinase